MIASEHRLALPAGYQLGRYRFKGVLGAGGFGITYLADDTTLGRRVAIKELLPNEIATRLDGTTVVAKTKSEETTLAWAKERFMEEGKALAACEHANVVHVYEMIEANGTAYMVTKFEDGRSMAEWLTGLGRAPNEAELRGLLGPLLSGLEKVHSAGFLHRDIKPENIYITEDGRPLLLDFGSARQAISDRSALLTSIVTIGYAPYEQYYEDGKQGPWSDIYAMAGVMYRAIHGDKPPEATRRLKNDSCTKLAKKYGKDYSAQFLNAIDRALAVEYQDRPQTVTAWRGLLGKGAIAQPENLSVSPREVWLNRLRHGFGLLLEYPRVTASVAGIGVLLCGWVIWKSLPPGPIPDSTLATPSPLVNNGGASFNDESHPVPPIAGPTPSAATPVAILPGPTPDHLAPNPLPPDPDAPAVVDPKMVGTWTTKIKISGSNYVTWHWEQLADGHYVTTVAGGGPIVDSGTLTADGGNVHRVSGLTHVTTDLTYEFKSSNELVTNDPAGVATWRRFGSTTSKSGNTGTHARSGNDAPVHHSAPNWQQYVPRSLPGRFGF